MSNSCHMQYGCALRWAGGLPGERQPDTGRGREDEGEVEGGGIKNEKKNKTDPNHKLNSSG